MQSDPDIDDDEIFDEYRWNLIYRRKQEVKIVEAFRFLRERDIEPILFKGWAAGRYYPPSRSRQSLDTDLAVSAGDYAAASEHLTTKKGRKLLVDLHKEFRAHDTAPWQEVFARCELVDIDGEPIRILCAEDHLRVICVHWLQDGGEYRDRLWDVYYLVANSTDLDWDLCLRSVSENRRRWIECTLGLAAKYLGLDLSGTPVANAADRLPAWLIASIERSWASEVRLEPLHAKLFQRPADLLRQVRKRTPPNPVEATIESEGSFDARSRVGYQIRSFGRRILPSFKRISQQAR